MLLRDPRQGGFCPCSLLAGYLNMKMALGYVSHLHRSGIPNLFFLPYTLADGISSQITLSLHTLRIFQGLPCFSCLYLCLLFLKWYF